jgi:hypothetical protein
MTTTEATKCPATGRTAKWCTDQTHAACSAAAAESRAIDVKVEAELRQIDRTY